MSPPNCYLQHISCEMLQFPFSTPPFSALNREPYSEIEIAKKNNSENTNHSRVWKRIKPTGSGITNAPTDHFSYIHTKSYSKIHLISLSIMSLSFIQLVFVSLQVWIWQLRPIDAFCQQHITHSTTRTQLPSVKTLVYPPPRAISFLLQRSRGVFLELWQVVPPQSPKANEHRFYFCKFAFCAL